MLLFTSLLLGLTTQTLALAQHQQRNITGSATPLIFPADTSREFTVIVRGTNFGTHAEQPDDLRCRVKVPDFEAFTSGPIGPATVLNDTAIECSLTGYAAYGTYGIAVESLSNSDPAKHQWWSSGTSKIIYRTLIEATPDRRPYLSNELPSAELLIAVNHGAIADFPPTSDATDVTICAELIAQKFNPYLPTEKVLDPKLIGLILLPCITLPLSHMTGGADLGRDNTDASYFNTTILSLPFDAKALALLPHNLSAANLNITTKVGKLVLTSKIRRFSVASSKDVVVGQTTSVVDHRRRMVNINGEPWVGVGFYASRFFLKFLPIGVPYQVDWEKGKNVLRDLARQGMTQIMPYDFTTFNNIDLKRATDFMDNELNSSIKFDMHLVFETMRILNSTVGDANYTKAWNELVAKVNLVRTSSSLLGYYICDDCDNAQIFPPAKMAQLYVAIKALDPYHIIIGAPWQVPWSLSQYGDDAGALSLDYLQVENYVPAPGYHVGWDERMRSGMFWEPIANSPPMYLLSGFSAPDGIKEIEPWPPVLESTLSWLGAMQFGAVSVVNFVIEIEQNHSAHRKTLDRQDHINAQGNYARSVRKLLPALMPSLTDQVSGKELRTKVMTSSMCSSPSSLPVYNGRPSIDLTKIDRVVTRGYRQRWVDPLTGLETFCGFVVVSNICGAPTSFTLDVENVPIGVVHARHQFDANYNVTLGDGDGNDGKRTLTDVVPGYGTSVLRLGCPGFTEACDGTGRVSVGPC